MELLSPLFASVEIVDWLGRMPWFGWIAIVAIVSGCFTGTIAGWQRHRERMEMIRLGMHPDQPAPGSEVGSFKTSHPEL